ncbi:MAG TPA: ATP-binding cassette domain-containing protein [Candidatus Acidoferrum sp.]|nr:ATP-binding cassette domain-containing protein [Candidatus Acidoferrum sp.]
MIGELAEMNARTRSSSAKIDFAASDRQTKQLITLDGVSFAMGERTLFRDIHFIITSGMRVGLVGPNGSGKTTLLRLLKGELKSAGGSMRQADALCTSTRIGRLIRRLLCGGRWLRTAIR